MGRARKIVGPDSHGVLTLFPTTSLLCPDSEIKAWYALTLQVRSKEVTSAERCRFLSPGGAGLPPTISLASKLQKEQCVFYSCTQDETSQSEPNLRGPFKKTG